MNNKNIQSAIRTLTDIGTSILHDDFRHEVGEAEPCYYGIKDMREEETVYGNHDKVLVYRENAYPGYEEAICPRDTLIEIVSQDWENDWTEFSNRICSSCNCAIEFTSLEDLDDENDIVQILEAYRDDGYEELHFVYVREEYYIVPNRMFLTYDAAKKHLEDNYYHYTPCAIVFAMTAWRNPEMSNLIDALCQLARAAESED